MEFRSTLKAYADRVDARLDELLPLAGAIPEPLHEAMRYSCLAPGKRLRPALCMAVAESVGGSFLVALDGACAIEMVHCFSLIHDDLPAIDDDRLRRGRPTCHVAFGEPMALLAGDGLFALAFDTIAHSSPDSACALAAVLALTRATGSEGLVGGEAIDVLSEGREVDGDTLETIHKRKTAALIRASCEIGAVLAGAPPDAVSRFATYGEEVGLAFQIADDLLDETATTEQLGKSAGSDRQRHKATYPAVHGIEPSRAAARHHASRGLDALAPSERSAFLSELAEFAVERLK